MSGAVVIGVGPGIGRAVAERFARAGLPVALVARSRQTVAAVAEALAPSGVRVVALTADSADDVALRDALDAAARELGPPDVVVYNAALVQRDAPGELSASGQLAAWAVNVVGAITAATQVAPGMAQRGGGTFIVTGGMPEPEPARVSLSLGKAGVRALVSLLAKHFGPSGVHVATVTVAGAVEPGGPLDPGAIAEHYWRLHLQTPARWQQEIVAHAEAGAA
jgi:NAD(P)-dependent dehydrogenase (short-subunit alcohol dehydrogenase family)